MSWMLLCQRLAVPLHGHGVRLVGVDAHPGMLARLATRLPDVEVVQGRIELLSSADPFPKNAGEKKGILVDAPVGKGTWTYVGLGLWRQLPAGTPGAYRILANILSRP